MNTPLCKCEQVNTSLSTVAERKEGSLELHTNYEQLLLPLSYETVQGNLSFVPAVVRVGLAFPGVVVRKLLTAQSFYTQPVTVAAITSPDPRFVIRSLNVSVPPGGRAKVGAPSPGPALKFSARSN